MYLYLGIDIITIFIQHLPLICLMSYCLLQIMRLSFVALILSNINLKYSNIRHFFIGIYFYFQIRITTLMRFCSKKRLKKELLTSWFIVCRLFYFSSLIKRSTHMSLQNIMTYNDFINRKTRNYLSFLNFESNTTLKCSWLSNCQK